MQERKKFVGLKLLRRPGAKRPSGEALSNLSRQFESERNQIARAEYTKLQAKVASIGIQQWNAEMHASYVYR